ncbi:MAG: dienelactone hydrolase family protein [Bdellovibrionales bacterium]
MTQDIEIITETIKIPAFDGDAFGAYLAMPKTAGKDAPVPAIIMIQEIFGVNAEMRKKCDEYAAQGYITICPDLFWRIEPGIELVDSIEKQLQRAFELFQIFDEQTGIEDLKTTLGYIRNHKACNGKVGNIGYCLGGKLSYMLATASDINASVSYYGVGIQDMLDRAQSIKAPILLHIAGEDQFVPKDAQDTIMTELADHPHTGIYRYDGVNHAFARGNGMHYDGPAATLANQRTHEFLQRNLH